MKKKEGLNKTSVKVGKLHGEGVKVFFSKEMILHSYTWTIIYWYTVPPESIYPLARGKTSSLPEGSAANSPRCDEFLNLVLDGRN